MHVIGREAHGSSKFRRHVQLIAPKLDVKTQKCLAFLRQSVGAEVKLRTNNGDEQSLKGAMSGGSGTNSSWTILTPEETVAETLKPLAEGKESHGDDGASTAGSVPNSQSAEGLPVEDHPASDKNKEALSEDSGTDHHTYVPSSVTDVPIPSSSEASSDALGQSEARADGAAEPSAHPDSFSDSYSHLTPTPTEFEPSPLGAETLGAADLPHQEESNRLLNGEELQQDGEGSDLFPRTPDLGKQADSHEDSEVVEGKTEEEKEEGELEGQRKRSLLAALERVGRAEEEDEAEEEFQLPQREDDSGFSVNKCILGAIILVGLGTIFFSGVFMDLDEEADYNTRELKDSEVPGKQQEWLNPEVPPPPVDAASSELLNDLAKGNQQISELETRLQAQGEELKVAKGQAAEGAAERLRWEEENSRLKKEVASLPVLQKENERMKRELENVPALQKELETLRSTVTELKHSAASEAARASASPAAPPSGGHAEDSRQGTGGSTEGDTGRDGQAAKKVKEWKDKHDKGERKQWEEGKKSEWKGEKKERKEGEKAEWKKGEQVKFDKMKDKESKEGEKKQWKEKEWTKEKTRGDDGKLWKERDGKKEWKEKNERKDWREEKDRKTSKHERPGEGKQWKGKEDNERKKGKGHAEGHKDEWKGERKVKDGFKESGREKWEKKEWKDRGERKEWRKEGEWKGKEHGKEGKGRGERKEWEEDRKYGKERAKDVKRQQSEEKGWKRKDERKEWGKEEGGKGKEWGKEEGWKKKDERKERGKEEGWKRKDEKKDVGNEGDPKRKGARKEEDWKRKEKKEKGEWKKEAQTGNHHHQHEEHLWGERKPPHSHRKPTPDQPEYWSHQRTRLQNNPKPAPACQSAQTCAQSEGLLPVPRPQFETLLQTYLAKAEEAGVAAEKREELAKLAAEFFPDGVFAHDRMSFRDFVEDLSDIMEDLVDSDEDGDDSALEDEMEEFGREAVEAFLPPEHAEKERVRAEWKKESGRERG